MRAQEFIKNVVSAADVLRYVKQQHNDFRLDQAVLDYPSWQLTRVPLNQLEIPDPETGEEESDPYDRVQWTDMGHVDSIDPQDIETRPIVIDPQGYIIDGNHRALAARLRGMSSIPAWQPLDKKSNVTEGVSSTLYHYTGLWAATQILETGEIQLSSTLGTDVEHSYAPPGYPYFLSATRTLTGSYHDYVGGSAVMFVLDGRWFNARYPGRAVDYWGNRDPLKMHHRRHEAEDRIFSRDPAIPLGGVRGVHVLVKPDADDTHRARTRRLLISAKRRGIPAYLYNDEQAWRRLDTVSVGNLAGADDSGRSWSRGHRGYLMPWMELIFGKNQAQLSKRADQIRYNLNYDFYNQDALRSLSADLSNARKPNSGPDREHVAKIIALMRREHLNTLTDLADWVRERWSPNTSDK